MSSILINLIIKRTLRNLDRITSHKQPWTTFYTNLPRPTAHLCATKSQKSSSSRCPLNQSSGKCQIFRVCNFCWETPQKLTMVPNSYLILRTQFLLKLFSCLDLKVIINSSKLDRTNSLPYSYLVPRWSPRDSLLKLDLLTTPCPYNYPVPLRFPTLLLASAKAFLTRKNLTIATVFLLAKRSPTCRASRTRTTKLLLLKSAMTWEHLWTPLSTTLNVSRLLRKRTTASTLPAT